LSWLPTYYNQEFGVDVQQSALLSVLPWFVTILVSNSSGWIADGLANSGRLSMTNTRKLLQTIGSVGPALALLYLATAHNNPGELEMGEAVGALTATLALGGFQSAGKRCHVSTQWWPHHIMSLHLCVEYGASCALMSRRVGATSLQGTAHHALLLLRLLFTSIGVSSCHSTLLVTASLLLLLPACVPACLQALLQIIRTSAADMQQCCLVSARERCYWMFRYDRCICHTMHTVCRHATCCSSLTACSSHLQFC
jgi:hypothetical protein